MQLIVGMRVGNDVCRLLVCGWAEPMCHIRAVSVAEIWEFYLIKMILVIHTVGKLSTARR